MRDTTGCHLERRLSAVHWKNPRREDLKGIILVSELLKLGEISRTFDRKGCLEIEQRFAGSVGPMPGFYNGLNCDMIEI